VAPQEMGGNSVSSHFAASSREESTTTSTIMSWTNLQDLKKFAHAAIVINKLAVSDTDNDTVLDGVDNCPLIANTAQTDTDADGLGDACDPDDDNDTVLDGVDNCPLIANTAQTDTDADGLGDACDPDDDNDTVLDGADNCPLIANTAQTDTDADGLGDVCDSTPTGGGGDSTGAGVTTTGGSFIVTGVVTPAGNDMLLVLGLASDVGRDFATATFGGIGLTTQVEIAESGVQPRVEIQTLVAPSGTNDLVINMVGGDNDKISYFYVFFSGVDQTTPIGTGTFTDSGKASSGNQPTITVTGTESGDTVFDIITTVGNTQPVEGASQTEDVAPQEMGGNSVSSHFAASSREESTTTSTIMSWTNLQDLKKFAHAAIVISLQMTMTKTLY